MGWQENSVLSHNKAAVALANKNARIIWSMLKTGEEFCLKPQPTAARNLHTDHGFDEEKERCL